MTTTESPVQIPADTEVRTIIVLDTSVLIADPDVLAELIDCDLVVPLTVIEELDGQKTRMDDVGRAARGVLRQIEMYRVSNSGNFNEAVPLANGSTFRVEVNGLRLDLLDHHGLDKAKADNRILAAALGQKKDNAESAVTLLSNDAALRIKAGRLGIIANEHHRANASSAGRIGWHTVESSREQIDAVHLGPVAAPPEVFENEFAVLRAGSQSALTRCQAGELSVLRDHAEAWGVKARAKEQAFALNLLLDPEVTVVALDGPAGTGKTLLAVAAALQQVVEDKVYERCCVFRPVIPVGKADLGYLPGGLDEKLDPWMQAIHDAVVALTDDHTNESAANVVDDLIDRGKLELQSVTYLRGRSLHNSYVAVDELQNLSPATLKTILTRIGNGSKVVFTGDTSQIDAPYLSARTNAMSVLTDTFTGQRCFGHVRLTSCERSEIASLAADLL